MDDHQPLDGALPPARLHGRARTTLELRHRKSVYKLDQTQTDALRAGIKRMVEISQQAPGDKRGWWGHAGIHGYPDYGCKHSNDYNDWAKLFLPWHRAFLLYLENDLQVIDSTVTLPYWDWTNDNDSDPASSRQAGKCAATRHVCEELL